MLTGKNEILKEMKDKKRRKIWKLLEDIWKY